MKSLVNLAGNDRELQQTINAFQNVYGEKATDMILDDENLEATFMNVMEATADEIASDDNRLGQSGFEPDIKWYLGVVASKDEYGEVQDLFDTLLKPVKDDIDREAERVDDPAYAIDKYGDYLCVTYNWALKDDVAAMFSAGKKFGFESTNDFITATKECTPIIDAYDAGNYGSYSFDAAEDCETPEDLFHINFVFLGNGEEEIVVDSITEYADIVNNVPDNVRTHYDDNAYVKKEHSCIYVVSYLLVYAAVKIADVIEQGKRLGLVDEDYQFEE